MPSPTKRQGWIALGLAILLNSAAMLLLKSAVVRISVPESGLTLSVLRSALFDYRFVLAVLSVLASTYFWVQSQKTIDLSLAYPTSSISYIVIAVASVLLFAETVTVVRVVGMAFVLVGVALLYGRFRTL